MTGEMLLLVGLFFGLLIVGAPVAFAIGISGFSFFAISQVMPASIGVQQVASASQSFPLLAVPFFVLAGHMMNKTGITSRLIRCSEVLVSWMSGGMAQVCIVLSTLMGGVSGSAVADAAMEARILGPDLVRNGYSKGFTAATIAVGSLITATIPPSLGLILYGFVGNVSIGRLFLAGIIPGLMMMTGLMITVWFVSRRRGYRSATVNRPSWRAVGGAVWHAKWALLFPVALLVSIRSGVFTPSEVGAFAVVYAVVVGVLLHRELTWQGAMEALLHGVIDNGLIVLIIMFSGMVGYAIIFDQAPQAIAQGMLSLTQNPTVILLLIVVFLLIAGCFIEATVLVLLLTPIFLPIVLQLGVDPVHFGIVMMTMVTFGGMTPPVGVAMFTVCGLLDCTIDEYLVEALPHIATILFLVAMLILFPQISLFLPNLLM
ncbi:TRAP transporter large permease [Pleomorphomonas sp. NRK KF1]|uniref:TRAP transporter large permease n=1 Tax=Pleomorphomonas sp. NRK KF1 TaxID=2943000 RepID=UPI002043D90D|nr:TRAP transporter large permease [Pleomorphomonas sp. NRK KF1]MCM5553824.1 TRAP transporter large permease [Pleomorphomonas sp. NRK KF1]